MPLEHFAWPELSTAGGTATAQAVRMLAAELTTEKMPRRSYPPVCILISDGFCTDRPEEYEGAIKNLLGLPWGQKAVRLAIAIGNDSEYDEDELAKFISHPEIGVLKADTPQKLVGYIRWASVSASVGASLGKSKTDNVGAGTSRARRRPIRLLHQVWICSEGGGMTSNVALAADAQLGWVLGCCRPGSTHIRASQPCQDAYAVRAGAVAGDQYLATAVADGHGDGAMTKRDGCRSCRSRGSRRDVFDSETRRRL